MSIRLLISVSQNIFNLHRFRVLTRAISLLYKHVFDKDYKAFNNFNKESHWLQVSAAKLLRD